MDTSPPSPPNTASRKFDRAFQIALAALLIFACVRIIVPFAGVLLWSAILAVMLYPLHLRLIGLTRTLKAGDRFDMILDFQKAGEVTVEVIVEDGSGH